MIKYAFTLLLMLTHGSHAEMLKVEPGEKWHVEMFAFQRSILSMFIYDENGVSCVADCGFKIDAFVSVYQYTNGIPTYQLGEPFLITPYDTCRDGREWCSIVFAGAPGYGVSAQWIEIFGFEKTLLIDSLNGSTLVTATPVPLPHAVLLFLTAIGFLSWWRKGT